MKSPIARALKRNLTLFAISSLIPLTASAQLLDSDGDSMPDVWEEAYGLDIFDPNDALLDSDGDFLINSGEFTAGTNPQTFDSDFDGVGDGEDLYPSDPFKAFDSDSDGMHDAYEIVNQLNPHDPFDASFDFDGDGLNELAEYQLGTLNYSTDSDNDGELDGDDPFPTNPQYKHDSDNDGMPDSFELARPYLNPFFAGDSTLDFDADGLSNLQEFLLGTKLDNPNTDGDLVYDDLDIAPTNPLYSNDFDSDGMPTAYEYDYGFAPYDHDGYLDLDMDGVSNAREFELGTDPTLWDSDGDFIHDAFDHYPRDSRYQFDSDRDGMPDSYERENGTDAFNTYDGGEDIDGDFLTNTQEFFLGTNPTLSDSDHDGVLDGEDLWPTDRTKALDSDNDGLYDAYEVIHGFDPFNNADGLFDSDGDGLTLAQEVALGTSNENIDTDNDGLTDDLDVWPTQSEYSFDDDNDGLPNVYEEQYSFLSTSDFFDALQDFDLDGLNNLQEFLAATDPENPDSDFDGTFDGEDPEPLNSQYSRDEDSDGMPTEWEYEYGFDPYNASDASNDFDGDYLTNAQEYRLGTAPDHFDTDLDGEIDGVDHFPLNPRYRADSDRDGMPNEFEWEYGLMAFDTYDGAHDPDDDFLNNSQEYFANTNPTISDTDADGEFDGVDLWPRDHTKALDSDNDGLSDAYEIINGLNPFDNFDGLYDLDGDGLSLAQEVQLGTSPEAIDTDNDGFFDNVDPWPTQAAYSADGDQDGLPDGYEDLYYFLYPFSAFDAQEDFDLDGLTNLQEFLAQTDPENPDSDLDGSLDGEDPEPLNPLYTRDEDQDGLPTEWEFEHELDPTYAFDAWMDLDGDHLSNLEEFKLGTSPNDFDTDGDGEIDGFDHYPLNPRYRADSDRDGMPDEFEYQYGLFAFDTYDGGDDPDEDFLNNSQEFFAGTHPSNPDSDFDGVLDGNDLWPTDNTKALDSDQDGLSDAYEVIHGLNPFFELDGLIDLDGDGLTFAEEIQLGTSNENLDSDGDDVPDNEDPWPTQSEYSLDDDNDGLPNNYEDHYAFLDPFTSFDAQQDQDLDGLSNLEEFIAKTNPENPDSDLDGSFDGEDPLPLNPRYREDEDNDGLPSEWEMAYGLDPSFAFDAWMDSDNDGLTNIEEFTLGTSPTNPDSDGDYLHDAHDHYPLNPRYQEDSDRDGMPNSFEYQYELNPYDTYDGANDEDFDNLRNSQEFFAGTNPNNPDSDFDGETDSYDLWPTDNTKALDSDEDGLSDAYEVIHGFDPFFPMDGLADFDVDSLTFAQEIALGTSDENPDSDADGLLDADDPWPTNAEYSLDDDQDGLPNGYEEIYPYSLNILDPSDAQDDYDNDGLSNLEEFLAKTNPENPDSDADGSFDGDDPAPLNPLYVFDEDNDGLPSEWEMDNGLSPYFAFDAWIDTDDDGLINIDEFTLGTSPTNYDSDGDYLNDNHDRYPLNPRYQEDSDRDGMPNSFEYQYGLNPFDTYDGRNDDDFDGLRNSQEFFAGTNPTLPDSDFDGVMDGQDLWPTDHTKALDSDEDGLYDAYEIIQGFDPFYPLDGLADFDGDSLTVAEEIALGTSDENIDSDFDGLPDAEDPWPTQSEYSLDDDNDGLPNAYEEDFPSILNALNPFDAQQDYDQDGLTALEEFIAETSPLIPDSDSDGSFDGDDPAPTNPLYSMDEDRDGLPSEWEMENGLIPTYAFDAWHDPDEDGLTNTQEFLLGTSPYDADSDGDYVIDSMDHYPLNPNYTMDMDRDTLPSEWEYQYGFSDEDTFDAISDIDGDGLTNIEEFEQGSDPTNASTPFELTMDADVDLIGTPGSFMYDTISGTYTVNAGGQNIGGWVDHFYYVYEEVSGDIDIRTRVASISNGWAAGGLMIRDSLDFGSSFSAILSEHMAGTFAATRFDYYTPSQHMSAIPSTEDIWLRLEKTGNAITTYTSFDGETWILTGTETITLGETFLVGFAAVTVESSPTTEFVFDSLSVIQ